MSRRAWRVARVPLAYLALTLALTWPMALHLGESLNEVGDPPLQAWTLAWNAHALRTDPARIWQAPIFYPYADTLAYADHHLLLSVAATPLIWLTDNPALALNLLVLLSFVLSAWAVYTLARDLTGEPWAAFVAGAGFAFCAYRMAHIVHLNLLQTAWLPWALVFLQRLLRPRELGGGRARDALLFGLFAALQAATAIYYAFFTVVVLSGAIALWALAAAWRRVRRGEPLPWATAGKVLLGGALAALLVAPLMLPYLRVSRTLGIVRSARELDNWSAPLRAYLSVDVHNRFYGATGGLGAITLTTAGEMILFPGAAIALLALLGLTMRERGARTGDPLAGGERGTGSVSTRASAPASLLVPRSALRAPRLAIALLGGAAFVLSLGTGLRLERGAPPLPIPLPYQALYARVPGFGALRVPSRWGWLVTLALAVLAALGLAWLLDG